MNNETYKGVNYTPNQIDGYTPIAIAEYECFRATHYMSKLTLSSFVYGSTVAFTSDVVAILYILYVKKRVVIIKLSLHQYIYSHYRFVVWIY